MNMIKEYYKLKIIIKEFYLKNKNKMNWSLNNYHRILKLLKENLASVNQHCLSKAALKHALELLRGSAKLKTAFENIRSYGQFEREEEHSGKRKRSQTHSGSGKSGMPVLNLKTIYENELKDAVGEEEKLVDVEWRDKRALSV